MREKSIIEIILFLIFFVSLFILCIMIYKHSPDVFNSIFSYVDSYIEDPNWTITILLLLVGLIVFYIAAFLVKAILKFF